MSENAWGNVRKSETIFGASAQEVPPPPLTYLGQRQTTMFGKDLRLMRFRSARCFLFFSSVNLRPDREPPLLFYYHSAYYRLHCLYYLFHYLSSISSSSLPDASPPDGHS